MSAGPWSFRTTDGVVTVRPDAITIRSTPGQFLAAQASRWRSGGLRTRTLVALVVGGFLFSVFGLLYHLWLVLNTGFNWSSVLYATSVGFIGYSLWRRHGRVSTIPVSRIETITLDDETNQLQVSHEPADGPLSVFQEDTTETTLGLSTDAALRTARETLQMRGYEFEMAPVDSMAEVTHRIVSRDGGHFCARCDSLVTPNDKMCPSCGYALWVETAEAR
mgnify:CR=1 FL=1